MKANRSDSFIAASVILCSLVLLGALTFALSGWRPSKKQNVIYIDFPDVTGVHVHSQVRYAGAPAGRVSGFRLLTDAERSSTNWSAVRVTVELFSDVPQLPDDVRASLAADTLLSEKFVALSAGSPQRPKLQYGSILLGASGSGLDTLADNVAPLVQSADALIRQLSGTIKGFDDVMARTGGAVDSLRTGLNDALPRISKLADGLKVTADTATQALARVDRVVADADPMIKEDLKKLNVALDDLQKAVKGIDQQIGPRMQELAVILQNLKVVSTHAKVLSKSLAEKPNRLIFSTGKPPVLPNEQEIIKSNKPVPTP